MWVEKVYKSLNQGNMFTKFQSLDLCTEFLILRSKIENTSIYIVLCKFTKLLLEIKLTSYFQIKKTKTDNDQ